MVHYPRPFGLSGHLLSHSNSFGFEMEKDAAGCRAFNRNYIVGGINYLLVLSRSDLDAIPPYFHLSYAVRIFCRQYSNVAFMYRCVDWLICFDRRYSIITG